MFRQVKKNLVVQHSIRNLLTLTLARSIGVLHCIVCDYAPDVNVLRRNFEPRRALPDWTSLLVEARVRFRDGSFRTWKCLVDTGAMFSVVRPDSVPAGVWEAARVPRQFQTASGEHLPGGQKGISVQLSFHCSSDGHLHGRAIKCRTWLYEAGIAQDAILSYDFLRRHRVCVLPPRNCLLFSERDLVVDGVRSHKCAFSSSLQNVSSPISPSSVALADGVPASRPSSLVETSFADRSAPSSFAAFLERSSSFVV